MKAVTGRARKKVFIVLILCNWNHLSKYTAGGAMIKLQLNDMV